MPCYSVARSRPAIHRASTHPSRRRESTFKDYISTQHSVYIGHACSFPCKRQVQSHTAVVEEPPTGISTSTKELRSIPDLFVRSAERYPDDVALQSPHHKGAPSFTFRELHDRMQILAAAFKGVDLQPGDVVCQFADNSSRWLLADQGIMLNGAMNAVRGANAPAEELAQIMEVTRPKGLVVQDKRMLERISPKLRVQAHKAAFVVLLWGEKPGTGDFEDMPVFSFEEFQALGTKHIQFAGGRLLLPDVATSSIATLVFTSGTTGFAKAVALSHANLIYQIEAFPSIMKVERGQSSLSLLPPWHIYERTVTYYLLASGGLVTYSSIKNFKADLKTVKPNFLVCVPLVLDTLHSRIMSTIQQAQGLQRSLVTWLLDCAMIHTRAKRELQRVAVLYAFDRQGVGSSLPALVKVWATLIPFLIATNLVFSRIRKELGIQTAIVSGGASLAPHLEDFYEAAGLPILNGWGLTETSPVIACRRMCPTSPAANVRGTVGIELPGTSVKIVNPSALDVERRDGEEGLLLVQGPGVFKEYWNDAEATASSFYGGYFITGDLGLRIPRGSPMAGQLVLTGRAKDTIVLAGGENVSPQPIEDTICQSPIIKHAMLCGQDKRTLGVLVGLDQDDFKRYLQERGDTRGLEGIPKEELNNAILAEVKRCESGRPGRKVWEVITAVHCVSEPFSTEQGTLTQTMKLVRSNIREKYATSIAELMSRIR